MHYEQYLSHYFSRLNDHGINYSDNMISSSNLTFSKKVKLYFRRLKHFLPNKILLLLCYAIVSPCILYGCVL